MGNIYTTENITHSLLVLRHQFTDFNGQYGPDTALALLVSGSM